MSEAKALSPLLTKQLGRIYVKNTFISAALIQKLRWEGKTDSDILAFYPKLSAEQLRALSEYIAANEEEVERDVYWSHQTGGPRPEPLAAAAKLMWASLANNKQVSLDDAADVLAAQLDQEEDDIATHVVLSQIADGVKLLHTYALVVAIGVFGIFFTGVGLLLQTLRH